MTAGAVSSGGDFKGFGPADFDAYLPKKWGSNAYTLERRKAKDRLLALARAASQELGDGLLDGLEIGASDEAPSVANGRKVSAQWVYFNRNAGARAALKTLLQKTDLGSGASLFDIAQEHQHLILFLRLDNAGLAIGLQLATKATVDRENAAKKLKEKWARDKVVEICRSLPFDASIGPEGAATDAHTLSETALEAWVAPLEKSEIAFSAQVSIPRTEEGLASEGLIGTVIEQLEAFIPLYRFLAWSRENDVTQVKDAIQVEKKKIQERAVSYEAGDRVTILSGLFAGRGGYVSEIAKGKVKVMIGPVAVTVDAKDLKPSS
jgi:hypothetical protein